MAADLHPATWVGPPGLGQLPDKSHLQHGDECLVTSEDLKSSYWQAVKPAGKKVEKAAAQEVAEATEGSGS